MKIKQFAGRYALGYEGKLKSFIRGLVMAVGAVLFLSGVAQAQTAGKFALHDSVNPGVFQSTPISGGELSANKSMSLAVSLPLHNQATLDATLADLYNPASPNYHYWLTTDEFVANFSPTTDDVAKVSAFFQKHGLTVTKVHSNRLVVDVSGPVSAVEEAFGVKMKTYRHPVEPRTFFGPDTAPTVENGVPILAVEGLDNFVTPRPSANGAGPTNGWVYRPEFAPGVFWDGTGQSIALFELGSPADPVVDIADYNSTSGGPPINYQYVLLDGVSPPVSGSGDGAGEEDLDIYNAYCMAPMAAIISYNGNSAVDIFNSMASQNTCKTVSCSYGFSPAPSTFSQILQQMAAQGQSVFDASGDGGVNSFFDGWDNNPYLTSVGGTILSSGPNSSWAGEDGWNGSGGGISSTISIPSWQQGISMTACGGSTTMRNIPDVAMPSPEGTSGAAPLWAGFVALANQQAAAYGYPTAGFINPVVYNILKGPNYTADFHDMTSGNNGDQCVSGYDLVTGIGSPTGQALINDLAGLPQYSQCASEGGVVNFSTPVDVAFGANFVQGVDGNYLYEYAQSGSVTFSTTAFGADPDPGVGKTGYSRPFTYCAAENGSSTFSVPVQAAFGAQGKYYYLSGVSGTVTFNNTTFGGDPDPGVGKAGYYMPYNACVAENQSYTFTTPVNVAFGAGGHYYYKNNVVGTITFNTTTFGDPAPGVFKVGYYRPTSGGAPLIANTSFETPSVGTGDQYNPTGGTWTFSGQSGIQGNGSGFGAPTAPNGTQTAFLQSHSGATNGSMSQTFFCCAGTYAVSFQAAQRKAPYNNGAISINVVVDGTVEGNFAPTSTTSYTAYTTSPFTLSTTGSHTIQLTVVGSASDNTDFVDLVNLYGIANGSFETPNIGANYIYGADGFGWNFVGNGGIQGNGSGFGGANAPNGTQTAFLQAISGSTNGSMSQMVYCIAGSHTLSFQAALRSNSSGSISFNVVVDGTVVGNYAPSSTTSYTSYTTPSFSIYWTGYHVVQFTAVGSPSNSTDFVDNIVMH